MRSDRAATLAVVALLVLFAAPTAVSVSSGAEENTLGRVSSGAEENTLGQTTTFERDPQPGRLTARLSYTIPDSVQSLTVEIPLLATERLSVASTRGFSRVDQTEFRWDRTTATPTVTVHHSVGDGSFSGGVRGVEGDGWAFVVEPNTAVTWRYRGDSPTYEQEVTVAGEGYATGHVAYMGPNSLETVEHGGERTTFVLGRGLEDTNLTTATDFLAVASEAFTLGATHDETTAFVLPLESPTTTHVAGSTVETTFWVRPEGLQFATTGNAFAHEYAHTRLGTVGRGSALWLTEATAEYYGRTFSLNYGVEGFEAYRAGLATERFTPNRTSVVLADPDTWRGTLANYRKGAHVLAALDAEIRTQTDGAVTLAAVFEDHPGEFESHAAFRRAVVDTTGESRLGEWLDRYVQTDALPPLPDDPALYVVGPDLDPDGDGLTSGTERRIGTDPFTADTDGDGLSDHRERQLGTDPTDADTDGDGVVDGTDPRPKDPARPTPTPRGTDSSTDTSTPANPDSLTGSDRTQSAGAARTTGRTGHGFGVPVAVLGITLVARLVRRSE